MNRIELHDAFVAQGCARKQAPQPAVTVGAGAIWAQAYEAVTTKGGRYVQGGGCTTVGVAGLIQSGGFGSFSKNYGLAGAALLEADVVTADGAVRIVNAWTHPDLFWALKDGGGGSLGVVTRLTLRTRELPNYFGAVSGKIKAHSLAAFRRLTTQIIRFYREHLFNPHWGEQIRFDPDNSVTISMVFQGLSQQQAAAVWRPFLDWVAGSPQDFSVDRSVTIVDVPARDFWNAEVLRQKAPGAIVTDDRPGAPGSRFFWAGDHGQVGWVLHGFKSSGSMEGCPPFRRCEPEPKSFTDPRENQCGQQQGGIAPQSQEVGCALPALHAFSSEAKLRGARTQRKARLEPSQRHGSSSATRAFEQSIF